jgi:hypothetical protein
MVKPVPNKVTPIWELLFEVEELMTSVIVGHLALVSVSAGAASRNNLVSEDGHEIRK